MVNQWQKNAYWGRRAYLWEMFLFIIRLDEIIDGFNGVKNKERDKILSCL